MQLYEGLPSVDEAFHLTPPEATRKSLHCGIERCTGALNWAHTLPRGTSLSDPRCAVFLSR